LNYCKSITFAGVHALPKNLKNLKLRGCSLLLNDGIAEIPVKFSQLKMIDLCHCPKLSSAYVNILRGVPLSLSTELSLSSSNSESNPSTPMSSSINTSVTPIAQVLFCNISPPPPVSSENGQDSYNRPKRYLRRDGFEGAKIDKSND